MEGLVKPPRLGFGGLLALDGPLAWGSTAKSKNDGPLAMVSTAKNKKRLYNLFGNFMTVLFPLA